ncbi:MAG: hypothetical protein HKM95_02295 [Inquilinus sp.]|nr:hypothetical protein [Inquilinus sp.]
MATLLLAACVPAATPLWPTLTGEPVAGETIAGAGGWPAPLALGNQRFQPPAPALGPPSGSAAGNRLRPIEADLAALNRAIVGADRRLQQLRGEARARADAYLAVAGPIERGLRAGAAPNDPALEQRLRQAGFVLGRLAALAPQWDALVGRVTRERATASSVVATAAAVDTTGGTGADERRRLSLARAARGSAATANALAATLVEDRRAVDEFLAAERAMLEILALGVAEGEAFGSSLAGLAAGAPATAPPPPRPGDPPLVTIRFRDESVRYHQPLYRAARLALERRADVVFTVVAVTPPGLEGGAAQADAVARSLAEMGVPAGQTAVIGWADPAATEAEIQVHVR